MSSERLDNRPCLLVVDDASVILKQLKNRFIPRIIASAFRNPSDPLQEFFIQHNIDVNTEILTAADGKEAYDMCLANKIALVVTDYNMPINNGDDFVRNVRSKELEGAEPQCVILGMSGDEAGTRFSGEGARGAFRLAGANAFIPKPVDIDTLKAGMLAAFRNELQIAPAIAIGTSGAESAGGGAIATAAGGSARLAWPATLAAPSAAPYATTDIVSLTIEPAASGKGPAVRQATSHDYSLASSVTTGLTSHVLLLPPPQPHAVAVRRVCPLKCAIL